MTYQPVDPAEVQRDYPQVAWFVEFWRALAQEDDGLFVTVGQIATRYDQFARVGRYPTEVAEDLGLPIPLSMQDLLTMGTAMQRRRPLNATRA